MFFSLMDLYSSFCARNTLADWFSGLFLGVFTHPTSFLGVFTHPTSFARTPFLVRHHHLTTYPCWQLRMCNMIQFLFMMVSSMAWTDAACPECESTSISSGTHLTKVSAFCQLGPWIPIIIHPSRGMESRKLWSSIPKYACRCLLIIEATPAANVVDHLAPKINCGALFLIRQIELYARLSTISIALSNSSSLLLISIILLRIRSFHSINSAFDLHFQWTLSDGVFNPIGFIYKRRDYLWSLHITGWSRSNLSSIFTSWVQPPRS
jgi:hypothetical protein